MAGKFERIAGATVLVLAAWAAGCGGERGARPAAPAEPVIADDIEARLAQFAKVELRADLDALSAQDRQALSEIVSASRVVDELFRVQQGAHVAHFAEALERAEATPKVVAAREYFRIMQGPWDRLAGDEPFVGEIAKPAGAGFYPEDLTFAPTSPCSAVRTPGGSPGRTPRRTVTCWSGPPGTCARRPS